MFLVLPLRVRRRLVTKGRLVRKPRKGNLCKVESVSTITNERILAPKENA